MKTLITTNKKNSKTYILKILVILLTFSNLSCKKDFLDIRQNPKLVKIAAEDCQALLDNYSVMNIRYANDTEISIDDYYLLSQNAQGNSTEQLLYRWDANAQFQANESNRWPDIYKVVYNANVVLQTLNNDHGTLDANTINAVKGAALFFRAYAFYNAAQSYAKPYGPTSDQDLGIPVRTSPDLEVESERGTVKQTYEHILQDFKDAANLLPATSNISSRPNKIAAFAALSRAYLSMEDYTNAGIYADSCLKRYNTLLNYNTISKTSTTPFVRFNSEVIFQSAMVGGGINRPDRFALIDTLLYRSYNDNDLRKTIFFKSTSGGFKFTGNYNQMTIAAFFNGLAVDEVYLIRAECYARNGKTTEAMGDLNALLINRWKTNTFTPLIATNPDNALSIILNERRKELAFRGIRWTDLRRLNKDPRFAKTLLRVINGINYTLPPNDIRYTLLLPVAALQYNNLQQNPR